MGISWDDELSRKLLVILIDEKERGCSKNNWNAVAKNLNARSGLSATSRQTQNHASALRSQFRTYLNLKGMTGTAIDPITKGVAAEEMKTERWKAFLVNNAKYGAAIAKKGLGNTDLLEKLYGGQTAHGVGGCFSPAMAGGSSYLSKEKEHITIEENKDKQVEEFGDSDVERINDFDINCSGDESASPTKPATQKTTTISSKRKSDDISPSWDVKRRNTRLDTVIELLSAPKNLCDLEERVISALTELQVAQIKGDTFFINAIRYLEDEKHAKTFVSLIEDSHKWMYLAKVESMIFEE